MRTTPVSPEIDHYIRLLQGYPRKQHSSDRFKVQSGVMGSEVDEVTPTVEVAFPMIGSEDDEPAPEIRAK